MIGSVAIGCLKSPPVVLEGKAQAKAEIEESQSSLNLDLDLSLPRPSRLYQSRESGEKETEA
jgi:hypothetical protein